MRFVDANDDDYDIEEFTGAEDDLFEDLTIFQIALVNRMVAGGHYISEQDEDGFWFIRIAGGNDADDS